MRQFKFFSAGLGVMLLAACSSNDVYDNNIVEEEYSKNFIEQFGLIDPNQDWNVAEIKSVTVNPGAANHVQIFALYNGIYKLVGNYNDVNGQQTLTFDAPKTSDSFLVTAGGTSLKVSNGAVADFTSTRGYVASEVKGVFSQVDSLDKFDWATINAFASRLPDGQDNSDADATGWANVSNFYARIPVPEGNVETIPVHLWPVFWSANKNHTVGIFWYDKDSVMHEQDVYTDKVGSDVQMAVTWRGTNESVYENVTWNKFREPQKYVDGKLQIGYVDYTKPVLSRAVTIDLPVDTKFGFYIKTWRSYEPNNVEKYYSDASLNKNGRHHSLYVKTKTYDTPELYKTYLAFEDVSQDDGGDEDLNDFVLILDPAPDFFDYDAFDWTIACEDLGDTDDYDFNDVVFKVSHVAGETKAWVTPLAAGGQFETYICNDYALNLEESTNIVGSEIHCWLTGINMIADNPSVWPMLNTYPTKPGTPGDSIAITVPADYRIGNTPTARNMGGFSILIRKDNGRVSQQVQTPTKGEVPQIICMPGDWEWPIEKTSITEAYPQFGDWGANYRTSEWYRYPVKDKVMINYTKK